MSRSTITPHASHVMREIDGEVCCAVCYAAPWMPIAEQQCLGRLHLRARDRHRHQPAGQAAKPEPERRSKGHPEALLQRAMKLHDSGMRWGQVAAELGLTGDGQTIQQAACALRVSVSRYKRAGCQRAVLGRPPKVPRQYQEAAE